MEWCLKAKWLPPAVITAQESWNERDKVWGRGEVLISLSRLQRLLQFNPYVSVTDAAKTITEVGRGVPAPSELLLPTMPEATAAPAAMRSSRH